MRAVLIIFLIAVAAAAFVALGERVHAGAKVAPAPRHAVHAGAKVAPAPRHPVHAVRHLRAPRRPPQFVVASFDGSGGARLLGYWRGVARRAQARFTFFVSGVYLFDWAHRDRYAPPGHARGESAIGFAPDQAWVAAMRRQLAAAYTEGHEIGTHYNGHFCGPGGVGSWSARDWGAELEQFDAFLLEGSPRLPFDAGDVVGGRTPCLEGDLAALYPVLARRGFRYDASGQALLGTWPTRRDGIWSFPLPELPFVGHTFRVIGMDYNFMANQIDESPARIESESYRTLWNAFLVSYRGNRAPLSLGNHFETWKSWAYDHALTRFLLRACRMPEVRCTSYEHLADWLDALQPKALRRYRA
ncbi:MAG: hypothetical protein QOH95_1301 [Gaiellaceae bacterium]|nr:hypothetical protein [Gaiellaceae bacterium]